MVAVGHRVWIVTEFDPYSSFGQMRREPELTLSFEAPPLSWKEAGPSGVGTEDQFLEAVRGDLNRCGGLVWSVALA